MKTKNYDPEMIFELIRKHNYNARKAAEASDIKLDTIKTIVYKSKEFRAERDKFKAEQKAKKYAKIRKLWNEGKTLRYILRTLNVDRYTVKQAIGSEVYAQDLDARQSKQPKPDNYYYRVGFYY